MQPHKLDQATIEVLCRELRFGLPKVTPFLPISDPFNGALKRLTQKANS
jgi:hypothetical protein